MLRIYFESFLCLFEENVYRSSKNINKKILWLLGVGVTVYYDLKYNR